MNKFFDTGEPEIDWAWLKQYKRDDIFLIQSCYNAKWAQDLNLILRQIMPTEPLNNLISGVMSYDINKKLYAYNCLNNNDFKKADKIFLVSGDHQFEDVFIKKKVYGIWHNSGFTHPNAGLYNYVEKEWGIYVYKASTKIFVASDVFRDRLKRFSMEYMNDGMGIEAHTVGFPILDEPQESKLSNLIIFNHRLNKDKHPENLFKFPKDLKKRLIVSAPKRTMPGKYSFSSRVEMEIGKDKVFYNDYKKDDEYKKIMNSCGFGLSFAEPETFGYSVVEGIMSGLFYFVPKDERSSTDEYMISEFLFNNLDELYDKIYFYSKEQNFNERIQLIKRQQQILYDKYNVKQWIENLIEGILL